MKIDKQAIAEIIQDMVLVGYANPAPSQYDLRFAMSGNALPVTMYREDLINERTLVLAAFCDGEHLAVTLIVPPADAAVAPVEGE